MPKERRLYIRTVLILLVIISLVTLSLAVYSFNALLRIERLLLDRMTPSEPQVESYILEEPKAEEVVMETAINDPPTIEETIIEISKLYSNVEPALVMSVIFHESRYDPKAKNGNCLGLMQVSTRWHYDRAERLGVEDFYDPYGNILLGVDYLSELIERHHDPALALMMYNMKHDTARKLYSQGTISGYAKSVLELADNKYEEVVASWVMD